MGDLISRKDAINRMVQETEESGKSVIHINTIKRLLQDIDTAYDPEKVVEQLKKEAYTTTDSVCGGRFEAIRLSDASEIVRKGGAE